MRIRSGEYTAGMTSTGDNVYTYSGRLLSRTTPPPQKKQLIKLVKMEKNQTQ